MEICVIEISVDDIYFKNLFLLGAIKVTGGTLIKIQR